LDVKTVVLQVQGRSAHGSLPHLGENAIRQMGDILSRLFADETRLWEFMAKADPSGKFLGIDCADDITGPLSCNLGMVQIGESEVRFTFDIRYPVDQTDEKLLQLIKQTTTEYGFQVEILKNMKPLYVPKESPVVATLQRVYESIVGQPSAPISIGGGTYARAIPNAVAFGPLFPGMEDLAHQKDECIGIEHLLLLTNIYANAVYELAK
jgi:succinyl-diaminopimelate desuccinylase